MQKPWCERGGADEGFQHVQDLIKKHSEFISYPISLWVEKTTEKEVDDDEEESSAPKEDEEEGKIEEVCFPVCVLAPYTLACAVPQNGVPASSLHVSTAEQGNA